MQSGRRQDGAMDSQMTNSCSINNCPNTAVSEEIGESAHWLYVVHYCQEHHRQIEKGTPVGPVGIDVTRIEVRAKGVEEPVVGGILPNVGPA